MRFAGNLTAVVAALPEEAVALRRRLCEVRPLRGLSLGAVTARLGALPIVLGVTGDGQENARQGLQALLAAIPVERVLVIGVSGALSAGLPPGALLVGERVVHESGASYAADRGLIEAATRALAARLAVFVSATQLADTVAEKQRLLGLPHVRGADVAVDLESAAYAAVARAAQIPWLCLRSISDTAGEGLPALLNQCRDEGGALRRAAVARRLFGDPRPLPALLVLRRRVSRCAEVLARAAEGLLSSVPEQCWPRPPLGA
jgi:nucleoside phosphorylase